MDKPYVPAPPCACGHRKTAHAIGTNSSGRAEFGLDCWICDRAGDFCPLYLPVGGPMVGSPQHQQINVESARK